MPIVLKSGSLNLLEPSGPVQACNGIALLYCITSSFHWLIFFLRPKICLGLFCPLFTQEKSTLNKCYMVIYNIYIIWYVSFPFRCSDFKFSSSTVKVQKCLTWKYCQVSCCSCVFFLVSTSCDAFHIAIWWTCCDEMKYGRFSVFMLNWDR